MFSCVRKCSYNKAEQIIQFSAFGWQNWKKKIERQAYLQEKLLNGHLLNDVWLEK